jgi:hypothetical protein
MVGRRVLFDDETWEAIVALSKRKDKKFQQLTEDAYSDLLKKHKQPVGLMESLMESVRTRSRSKRKRT